MEYRTALALSYIFYTVENVEDCSKLREYQYKNGVYTIYPFNSEEGINVFCNMTNGGWTVIYSDKQTYKLIRTVNQHF